MRNAIDESAWVALPDGRGVLCGERKGFLTRLDADGEIVRVVYLDDGNPYGRRS